MLSCLGSDNINHVDIYNNNQQNKVYLLGDEGVGKSNIINCLLGMGFKKKKNKRTGIFSDTLKINENFSIVFKTICDTKDYRYTKKIRNDIQEIKGVIIVFSLIDRNSFEKAKELISFILEYINNDEVHIILVGNKSDLIKEDDYKIELSEISETLIGITNSCYYEISCLNRSNIDKLKREIINLDFEDKIQLSYDEGIDRDRSN
jgi:small GTP-binding protein